MKRHARRGTWWDLVLRVWRLLADWGRRKSTRSLGPGAEALQTDPAEWPAAWRRLVRRGKPSGWIRVQAAEPQGLRWPRAPEFAPPLFESTKPSRPGTAEFPAPRSSSVQPGTRSQAEPGTKQGGMPRFEGDPSDHHETSDSQSQDRTPGSAPSWSGRMVAGTRQEPVAPERVTGNMYSRAVGQVSRWLPWFSEMLSPVVVWRRRRHSGKSKVRGVEFPGKRGGAAYGTSAEGAGARSRFGVYRTAVEPGAGPFRESPLCVEDDRAGFGDSAIRWPQVNAAGPARSGPPFADQPVPQTIESAVSYHPANAGPEGSGGADYGCSLFSAQPAAVGGKAGFRTGPSGASRGVVVFPELVGEEAWPRLLPPVEETSSRLPATRKDTPWSG